METLDRVLAAHPFLAGMPPAYLQLLAGCAANVRFEAGQLLFREGEAANHFYLIREGRVAIELHAPERGTIILQTLDGDDVVGWSWLVPPHTWRYDARAVELTRALALDGACLREKCESNHDLGYELLKRFAQVIAERLEAARLQLINLHGPLD